jgi:DNA-binding IclR family transcriptional regulator
MLSGTAYLDRDPALRYGDRLHHPHARRDKAHVLYLASRESRDSVRVVSRVGRRLPVHVTALGQALLADLTEAEVDALLPAQLTALTPNTITERSALHAELDVVRKRGWAFEREQGTEGVACVAVAVGYRIPATDAVSCSMPAHLVTGDHLEQVAEAVTRHTEAPARTLRREGIR